MPRKLPNHSLLLMFYLKNIIPKNWKILSLENISEKLLIEKLSKSKIFLSFSNFEGLGLPPIEAAISGNKVIGYDGGGGVEYWKKPIFIKIENGDIKNFGKKTLLEIKNYQKNWVQTTKKFRTQLINQYSDKRENKSLVVLRNKIQKLFK
jgi:glycosyltransferase involved in cell wall biosynthesis